MAEELHKPIIRQLKKYKIYPSFKDNIWGEDLANMQWISAWLQGDDIEMYLTYNKRKSVVAERFIIALKNKI